MRKKLIAANWKMNLTLGEVEDWVIDLNEHLRSNPISSELVIFPSHVFITVLEELLIDNDVVKVGAQNISRFEKGAYTGEVSALMLASLEVPYVLIGHSERRSLFNESDIEIAEKLGIAIKNNLNVILCFGEPLFIREKGEHFDFVRRQLDIIFSQIDLHSFSNLAFAYEPIWAIGTGVTATASQAQEMHQFIRKLVSDKYGQNVASEIRILYGGSCNSSNAKELFSCEDVDGGLIGGASLNVSEFIKIINQAQ